MTQLEFLNLNQGREQPGWLRNISTNKVNTERCLLMLFQSVDVGTDHSDVPTDALTSSSSIETVTSPTFSFKTVTSHISAY